MKHINTLPTVLLSALARALCPPGAMRAPRAKAATRRS